MIDNKTPHLSLPLPHESNLLTDDVPRLREAFASLDAHAAQLETDLVETIAAATDAAKTALWAGITGKPNTFPPATHGHTFAELGDAPTAFPPAAHGHDWAEVGGKPASYPPETHEHNAAYAAKAHSHPASELSEVIPVAKGGTGNTSGNISGNAGTATRLQSSRKIEITGGATGSAYFDGTRNITLNLAVTTVPLMPSTALVASFGSYYDQMYMTTRHYPVASLPSGGTWGYSVVINGQSVTGTSVAGGTQVWADARVSGGTDVAQGLIAKSSGNIWRIA